jgi:PAS domain S-box-containing protein
MALAPTAAPSGLAPPVYTQRRIATYVLVWTGVAVLAALSLTMAPTRPGAAVESRPAAILLFAVITVAAEGIILYLHHGKATEFITLVEAAVAINILLFSYENALLITLSGMAIANLLHRRHPIKFIFNIAQYTVSTMAALIAFHYFSAGADALSAQGLIALAFGVTAFGVTNLVAMTGLVSILEDKSFVPVLRSSIQMSALTVYGNAAVGIVAAVLWQTRPEFLALLVVPAATLHLAYRGVVRSAELLEEVVIERDRLNRIVVGASDGIVLLDRDGRVAVWSPAMVRLTGIGENEAQGRLITEVLIADDPSGQPVDSLKPLSIASPDAPVTSVELVLRHREGGERVAQARHTTLFDQHGACTGDAILIHDITHEYEAERLKDDFLARVSHELRTPLTPIKGYAQTLLRKKGNVSPERMEDALSRIVERVDHMTLLIDDVLLVARMVAGSTNLEGTMRMGSVDLLDLIEHTLPPFRSMEPDRIFEVIAEPDLPLLVADRTRVAQIAANLVSNACKYSSKDQPVTIELSNEGPWIALGVIDRGRGIPAEQADKVFERFHRLENPLTMETGGIGLGLYITRGFAEAMGGTLNVSSKVGAGSTFTLRLPNPEWKPAAG